MRTIVTASVIAIAASSLLAARPARACGGCFHSPAPKQVTVVTGHRMAFSISPTQSVLWDQIEYSGSPQDFAWVLPVRTGAKIELSHDEFFAALDATTDPVITGPAPNCGNGGGGSGFGCGSSASAGGGSASGFSPGTNGGNNGVQVLSQGVVGPYDQVTLHSTNPNALYDWLVVNKYDVPSQVRPIVDAYVGAGFDFIALRLAPGQGVQAMQPVRVVTPGAGLSLPLRMVAAGVGANVGITLYVISDGRYQAQNFPNGVVDDSKLVWLHAQSESNYEPLAEQIMQGGGGRTWLTEYAQNVSLSGSADAVAASNNYSCGSTSGGAGVSTNGGGSLADLYFAQCLCLGASGPQLDASSDGGVDNAPCEAFDDLSVAAVGLDPASTWVSRMRAILPASALSEGDLVIEAAPSQSPVSSNHTASHYDDPTYDPCPNGSGGCNATDEAPPLSGRALVVGAFALLGIAIAKRRRAA